MTALTWFALTVLLLALGVYAWARWQFPVRVEEDLEPYGEANSYRRDK